MNIFHKPEGLIIKVPLPKRTLEVYDRLQYDFTGSVLDPLLDSQPGYIPVRNDIRYYDSYSIRKDLGYPISDWTPLDRIISLLKSKALNPNDYIHITKDNYLMTPPGINRQFLTDTGIAVLDDMQRTANSLVEYNIQYRDTVTMRMRYQMLITSYIDTISRALLGKSRLFDKITGCIHPISGRAVISCNPTLPVDTVGVPGRMIHRWMKNEEFRIAYDIPEDENLAYPILKDRLVIVGRQPIHSRSSIVSMKLRIMSGNTIQLNPILASGIFGADYDGDSVFVAMSITLDGISAMKSMYIGNLLSDPFSKICKEIRFSQPNEYSESSEYLPNDIALATVRSRELFRSTTDGYSISYHDLVEDSKDSRFNHILNEDQKSNLHHISQGIAMSELYSNEDNNLSVGEAVAGYRILKSTTAKFHGAMNSAITLAIALYGGINGINDDRSNSISISSNDSIHDSTSSIQDRVTGESEYTGHTRNDDRVQQGGHKSTRDLIATIRELANIKRKLTDSALSSKHGGECRRVDDLAVRLQSLFYYPERAGWTDRDQARNFLVDECRLPDNEVEVLLDVIWTEPPMNINNRLRKICPTYMMTRRNSTLDVIDNWDGNDNTITQYFYNKE